MMPSLENPALEIIRNHQNSAPVDVAAIATDLGIAIWESDEMESNVSGALFRDTAYGGTSGYSILLNRTEALTRKRFTVAHEIAHYVLHRNLITDGITDDTFYRSKLSSAQEVEANRMAADIVMPHHLIAVLTQAGVRDVKELAKRFGVSESAMKIRLGIPIV